MCWVYSSELRESFGPRRSEITATKLDCFLFLRAYGSSWKVCASGLCDGVENMKSKHVLLLTKIKLYIWWYFKSDVVIKVSLSFHLISFSLSSFLSFSFFSFFVLVYFPLMSHSFIHFMLLEYVNWECFVFCWYCITEMCRKHSCYCIGYW